MVKEIIIIKELPTTFEYLSIVVLLLLFFFFIFLDYHPRHAISPSFLSMTFGISIVRDDTNRLNVMWSP